MKNIFLQLTENLLLLTPSRKNGRQNIFDTPLVFPLPETLCGEGKALAQVHELAVFAAHCIRSSNLTGNNVIFCLDSNTVVIKEFKHLPAKTADLQKFAKLEAQTFLQDGPSSYFIATREYGYKEAASGQLKAVFYAVPQPIIDSISQEFHRVGVRVTKICPLLSGMMSTCQNAIGLSAKSYMYKNRTVAVIDVGYEHVSVMVFTNGYPIFQKEFSSVWLEILEMLRREESCTYEEALHQMAQPGFLLNAGKGIVSDSAAAQIGILLESAAAEAVRNTRVVLSSERLEPEKVIVSGAVAAHPDFLKYAENLGLGVPFENVEITSQRYKTSVAIEPTASAAGCHPIDFFTLEGLLLPHTPVDYMLNVKTSFGSHQLNVVLCVGMIVVAALVMAIQPIMYLVAAQQVHSDENALNAPEITEIKGVLAQQDSLQTQLKALKADENLLPYQKSKMEEAVTKLHAELIPQIASITNCQIDGTKGTITLTFTTTSFEQFNDARKAVAAANYFDVLIPFSASVDDKTNKWQCSAALYVRNYKPFMTSAANGGGK